MKIVNLKYFDVMEINESCPETLVIENPQLLRNMLEELIYQEETDDVLFVRYSTETIDTVKESYADFRYFSFSEFG